MDYDALYQAAEVPVRGGFQGQEAAGLQKVPGLFRGGAPAAGAAAVCLGDGVFQKGRLVRDGGGEPVPEGFVQGRFLQLYPVSAG